jgi:hypothetical protein
MTIVHERERKDSRISDVFNLVDEVDGTVLIKTKGKTRGEAILEQRRDESNMGH